MGALVFFVVAFRGDFKVMSEMLGLPEWKSGDGICWKCLVILDGLRAVDHDACHQVFCKHRFSPQA